VSISDDTYYGEFYTDVQRTGLLLLGNGLLDRSVEKSRRRMWERRELASHTVLELGSSSGEHQLYVRVDEFSHWIGVDLQPGLTRPELLEMVLRSRPKVSFLAADAHRIPMRDASVDEVVATCLLHHTPDAESVFAEIRRILRPGGTVCIAMPTDPGFMNRLVKRLYTYPKMRSAGIPNPRLVYAREHVNAIDRIVTLFENVLAIDAPRVSFRPFRLPSWNLNLYVVITARKQD